MNQPTDEQIIEAFERYGHQMGLRDFERAPDSVGYSNAFVNGPWNFFRAGVDWVRSLASAQPAPIAEPLLNDEDREMLDSVERALNREWNGLAIHRFQRLREKLEAAATPAQPVPATRVLPHPGSPEASAMLDSLLAEYNWPANSKNAARAGWEAANRWLAAAPEAAASPQITDARKEDEDQNRWSGLSWDGHQVRGDRASIDAMYAALHEASTVPQLKARIREAEAQLRAAPPAPSQMGSDELAQMTARKNAAYEERNKVVAALAKLFPSGVAKTAIEGWSEDWHGCVYIDLPTGQVSWHFHDSQAYLFSGLPPYTKPWDGHDTPEKYRRLAALPMPSQMGSVERDAKEDDRG